jgi:hypothetical protein
VMGDMLARGWWGWGGSDIDSLIEIDKISGGDQLRTQMEVSSEHQSGVQSEVNGIGL